MGIAIFLLFKVSCQRRLEKWARKYEFGRMGVITIAEQGYNILQLVK